jgi:hypothetical protein
MRTRTKNHLWAKTQSGVWTQKSQALERTNRRTRHKSRRLHNKKNKSVPVTESQNMETTSRKTVYTVYRDD